MPTILKSVRSVAQMSPLFSLTVAGAIPDFHGIPYYAYPGTAEHRLLKNDSLTLNQSK